MSGPISVIMSSDPMLGLLSAAAIRAGMSIADAQQQAKILSEQQEQDRVQNQQTQKLAIEQGQQALQQQLQSEQNEYERLKGIAEQLGYAEQIKIQFKELLEILSEQQSKDGSEPAAQIRYQTNYQTNYQAEQQLQLFRLINAQLRPVLLNESARRLNQLPLLDQADFSSVILTVESQNVVQRLLSRIAHLQEIPASIQELADELTNELTKELSTQIISTQLNLSQYTQSKTLYGARASALATELRIQIQALLEAEQQRQLQLANAVILEQSLKDLGYQVESIADTLFIEGGILHFRRADWGNYMLRMRIDAQRQSANFNVIRAVQEHENERSVLDHLAEDRWCAEFPAFVSTLQARGLTMQVTRRLEAGELPVQLVAAEKLPKFEQESESREFIQAQTKVQMLKTDFPKPSK